MSNLKPMTSSKSSSSTASKPFDSYCAICGAPFAINNAYDGPPGTLGWLSRVRIPGVVNECTYDRQGHFGYLQPSGSGSGSTSMSFSIVSTWCKDFNAMSSASSVPIDPCNPKSAATTLFPVHAVCWQLNQFNFPTKYYLSGLEKYNSQQAGAKCEWREIFDWDKCVNDNNLLKLLNPEVNLQNKKRILCILQRNAATDCFAKPVQCRAKSKCTPACKTTSCKATSRKATSCKATSCKATACKPATRKPKCSTTKRKPCSKRRSRCTRRASKRTSRRKSCSYKRRSYKRSCRRTSKRTSRRKPRSKKRSRCTRKRSRCT